MAYKYDASRKALFTPARDTTFFPAGRPTEDAALCAEMSRLAYAAFERDPQAAADVQNILSQIGFGSCTFFSAAGTQGFLAQDLDAALSILTFRGTELDLRDWLADLDARPVLWPEGGQTHRGFAAALDKRVWAKVEGVLALSQGRLLYTGHSLGAALATLAASRRSPHALYTFGSPRVGDSAFAQTLTGLDHRRYVNSCDFACQLPPKALDYQDAGPGFYLDQHGRLRLAPSEDAVARDQRDARRAYLWQWAWRPGTNWTRDLSDHAPVNYASAVAASLGAAP
jgi:hypothetical protein